MKVTGYWGDRNCLRTNGCQIGCIKAYEDEKFSHFSEITQGKTGCVHLRQTESQRRDINEKCFSDGFEGIFAMNLKSIQHPRHDVTLFNLYPQPAAW